MPKIRKVNYNGIISLSSNPVEINLSVKKISSMSYSDDDSYEKYDDDFDEQYEE